MSKKKTPEEAKRFFARFLEDPANKVCMDCDTSNPQWASVPFGIYLCLVCAGVHRSKGTDVSFVRSLTMDKWTERQLTQMMVGGNKKFKEYLMEYDQPVKGNGAKYSSRVVQAYKEKILCMVEGRTFHPPPKDGAAGAAGGAGGLASSDGEVRRGGGRSGGNGRGGRRGGSGRGGGRGGGGARANNGGRQPQYSSASEAERLRKFEGQRGISSDSYFGNDSAQSGPSDGASGADYANMLGEGLSKFATTVSSATKAAAETVAVKAGEVKKSEFSAKISEATASGWSTVASYWGKAKESSLAQSLAASFADTQPTEDGDGSPEAAASASASASNDEIGAGSSRTPVHRDNGDADDEDDFQRQLEAAKRDLGIDDSKLNKVATQSSLGGEFNGFDDVDNDKPTGAEGTRGTGGAGGDDGWGGFDDDEDDEGGATAPKTQSTTNDEDGWNGWGDDDDDGWIST